MCEDEFDSLESTPQVESLSLSLCPSDTLSEGLLSERERVLVISSGESLEGEDQGRVGLGGGLGKSGSGV